MAGCYVIALPVAGRLNLRRGGAEVRHKKRATFGDVMTSGEKIDSVVTETKENAKADIDKAKREIRDLRRARIRERPESIALGPFLSNRIQTYKAFSSCTTPRRLSRIFRS